MLKYYMRSVFLFIAGVFLATSLSHAWDNPCYSNAMGSKSVPKETRFTITLESKRVQSIQGNVVLYDLGKEIITIRADGLAAKSFLKEVREGRCHAKEPIMLEPDTNPSSGVQYKTVLTLPH